MDNNKNDGAVAQHYRSWFSQAELKYMCCFLWQYPMLKTLPSCLCSALLLATKGFLLVQPSKKPKGQNTRVIKVYKVDEQTNKATSQGKEQPHYNKDIITTKRKVYIK